MEIVEMGLNKTINSSKKDYGIYIVNYVLTKN